MNQQNIVAQPFYSLGRFNPRSESCSSISSMMYCRWSHLWVYIHLALDESELFETQYLGQNTLPDGRYTHTD